MNTSPRRIAALLSTFVVALVATLGLATGPANATAYRYWSYWQGSTGTWVAASTGPADHKVVDQDVQGWRFGISTTAPTNPPDNAPDFAALCPGLSTATAGQARVAVVIDGGFAADAPKGQTPPADTVSCVTVPDGSTGSQALAAAGTVTEQGGMVCALNGFPADECSAEVSDADASAAAAAATTETPNPAVIGAAASTSDDSSNTGVLVGAAALVALIAVVGMFIVGASRRRASRGSGE